MVAVGGVKNEYLDYWQIAGKMLKSQSGWDWNTYNKVSGNGIDEYGFSALPGGNGDRYGDFYRSGNWGGWWSATEFHGGTTWSRSMDYYDENVASDYNYKTNLYSVRCVKN